ncbi:DUF4058 family protein [Zavarzinella formosa]|uniref:DUF4058 family protein n=1 Tax=Zavarzinella formosa TaxID=360055 RepID=UPI0002D5DAAE|nr:DUF4058 family protein [Zavarzinella formosa]
MLRDHFHSPLSEHRPWEAVHSAWAAVIAETLNDRLLPPGYVALPLVTQGTGIEIDVAAIREHQAVPVTGSDWMPAKPAWTADVEFPARERFEVRVFRQDSGNHLVGAVELVSPANKDRPARRLAFAGKCAGYLRQGAGLVTVDVVTERTPNLHRELLDLLELAEPNGQEPFDAPLYAVAYRTLAGADKSRLELWPEPLAIGGQLPILPLWLADDLVVPVDLQSTYTTTCQRLRIG